MRGAVCDNGRVPENNSESLNKFWELKSCASKVLREADEEWNSSTECEDDRLQRMVDGTNG